MILHTIIGVGLMFSGLFLPTLSIVTEPTAKLLALGLPQVDGGVLVEVTRMGMVATIIFLGVVYLWTFVDTLWPGFLGLLMLIFCGYAPAPKILNMFFGNPMVVMIFIPDDLRLRHRAQQYRRLAGALADDARLHRRPSVGHDGDLSGGELLRGLP